MRWVLMATAVAVAGACPPAAERQAVPAPPRNGGVYVVAHRGAHRGVPENSLPAYRKAIELGADFVEIDVRTTRDGRFVSIHDATIDDHVDGASGNVAELTLAELRALDIGARVGPEWKGTRIPTLEEILDLCRGRIGVYLDLKDAPISELARIVRRHGMQADVLWYASHDELDELRKTCPECIPMPEPDDDADLPAVLARFRPRVVATRCERISPAFLRACHDAGAVVLADDDGPDDWAGALDLGLDGIQTDHPAELIEYVKQRARALRR